MEVLSEKARNRRRRSLKILVEGLMAFLLIRDDNFFNFHQYFSKSISGFLFKKEDEL